MLETVLTPDTVSISSPTKADLHTSAISCTRGDDAAAVEDLLRHSVSEHAAGTSIRLQHFADWGGAIPASPAMIAAYVAAFAGRLAVATIERRVATLSKAHDVLNIENPCRSALVKATLQGLKRKHGIAPKQAKALMRDDLFAVLDAIGGGLKDARDRALLLLGFAGGFRRSELVGLDVSDIETVRQGLVITLRRSKTDQEGAGRRTGIPHGRGRHCPMTAVMDWL